MSISNYMTPASAVVSNTGRKTLGKTSPLANSFSVIEYNQHLRFLIMDCPTNTTIKLYLKEFVRLNVTDVVRVCESTYDKALVSENVTVHDMPFKDGDVPPASVLKQWLQLVKQRVNEDPQPVPKTVAVHCVAGLGRAPVLVAIALIERGDDSLDAIEYVRKKRRGAFNNRQLDYLANQYKRSPASRHAGRSSSARPSPLDQTDAPPQTASRSFFRKMFGSKD